MGLTFFTDYVDASFDNSGDVPRIPPLRYGVQVDYDRDNWSGNIRWTEVDDQDSPGDNETATDGYSRLDASLNYELAMNNGMEYTLFLKGKNLLDEEIRNATSFLRNYAPEAGRSIETGVRIMF